MKLFILIWLALYTIKNYAVFRYNVKRNPEVNWGDFVQYMTGIPVVLYLEKGNDNTRKWLVWMHSALLVVFVLLIVYALYLML